MNINLQDIRGLIERLSKVRPVFHSEADFQHAWAWEFHKTWPEAEVWLEYRPLSSQKIYLDFWTRFPDGSTVAIELKYKTREASVAIGEQRFELLDQSASDCGRYDYLNDLQRLELVARSRPGVKCFAIFLTNYGAYWTKLNRKKEPNDVQFRLHEGREFTGVLEWGPNTGNGTKDGREEPINLSGHYQAKWHEYSAVQREVFRYLLLEASS